MIAVLLALLNSPLVWFALLLLSLIGAGVLVHLAIWKAQNQPPMFPSPSRDFDSPAARRYHGDDAFGR